MIYVYRGSMTILWGHLLFKTATEKNSTRKGLPLYVNHDIYGPRISHLAYTSQDDLLFHSNYSSPYVLEYIDTIYILSEYPRAMFSSQYTRPTVVVLPANEKPIVAAMTIAWYGFLIDLE
jgi:hypothetical protein